MGIWIPAYSAGQIARFDPLTETFRVWDLPLPDLLPYVIRVDQSTGTVWIGTGHGDVVLSFYPSNERFTAYELPTRGALVRHLDVDEARGEILARLRGLARDSGQGGAAGSLGMPAHHARGRARAYEDDRRRRTVGRWPAKADGQRAKISSSPISP